MANIITIGEILVEVMSTKIGQKFHETGHYEGPFPSGAPAIFTDQASNCGSEAMIISAVGNDGFGKLNIERLEKSGANIHAISVLDDETTGVAFVTYKDDGDRDFIFHISKAACGSIKKEMVKEEYFRDCKYFHIMGSAIYNETILESIEKGIKLAKKYGAKISFDPNVRKEIVKDEKKAKMLKTILDLADIIVAGDNELTFLLGIEDEKEIIDYLHSKKAEIVIVKRGIKGSTLYDNGTRYEIDPYIVKEVDPTGAGDCYVGTFISCLNLGIDAVIAAKYSSVAGAMAVSKKGPMTGNTTLKEIKEIVDNNIIKSAIFKES